VLTADLRCDCGRDRHRDKPCLCLGDLLFRGACRGCDWEGEPGADENPAAEAACDHAWPGWRALPVVERMSEEHKPRARLERVTGRYPPGWVHAGGPIRTHRAGMGPRHVPSRTPFGGYDMAADPDAVDPG
jgi:hypothetical protein